MDVLLSLPFLAYFSIQSLSSYSTSLNLMFFWMTWSTLVFSHSPLKLELIGVFASYLIFFIIPASLFLLFDTVVPSLAVGFKIQGAAALPTRTTGSRGTKLRRNNPKWYRVVGLSLLNVSLTVAFLAAIEWLFVKFGRGRILKITATLPMPWTVAQEISIILVLREILQYTAHRLLHRSKSLYVARLHQSYQIITTPYAFSAHYDHPLPHFIRHALCLYLPMMLVRPHLLTFVLQLSVTNLASTLTHSGYTFPGIILGGATRRCDLHYSSHGKGNFSSSGILDWAFGTGIGMDVVSDIKGEAEQHSIGERAKRGLRRVGRKRN